MALEVSEVTLKQFVESTWFKGIARGAMIVGAFIGGYIGWLQTTMRAEVTTLQASVSTVRASLADKVNDQARFQLSVDKDLDELDESVAKVDEIVDRVQSDVATMKGIMQEMQRRDLANRGPAVGQMRNFRDVVDLRTVVNQRHQ
jgi:hypothetical protein